MESWPDAVEAVFVDVGGVLFVPDTASVASALRDCGVRPAPATLARAHYVAQHEVDVTSDRDRYAPAYAAALLGGRERVSAIIGHLFAGGRPAHPWRRDDSAVAALRAVTQRDWKVGIVSNSSGDLAQRLLRTEVCQCGEGPGAPVGVIVDSGRLGIAKPDPGIFHSAIAALQVRPAGSVHIGDSILFDVQPARAAGLVGVHYDPFDVCRARSDHPHLRSLRDVIEHEGTRPA